MCEKVKAFSVNGDMPFLCIYACEGQNFRSFGSSDGSLPFLISVHSIELLGVSFTISQVTNSNVGYTELSAPVGFISFLDRSLSEHNLSVHDHVYHVTVTVDLNAYAGKPVL